MQMGKCLTWDDHCAASWKNLTSFHSTPSMRTVGRRACNSQAEGTAPCQGPSAALCPSYRLSCQSQEDEGSMATVAN